MEDGGFVQEGQLDRFRPSLAPGNQSALRIWNTLRGVDWVGLCVVLALEPVDDVRGLVWRLCLIRDHIMEKSS